MLSTANKMLSIEQVISFCLQKNLPFAAYRLPNSTSKEMIIQLDDNRRIINPDESFINLNGFVVSPFEKSDVSPSFIIKPDIYFKDFLGQDVFSKLKLLPDFKIKSNESHIPEELSHSEYITQLNSVVKKIRLGDFDKVVLSRVKIVEGKYINFLDKIFFALSDSYPNAFIYIFNSGPDLWIGATPEPLLKARNGNMQTVSLAGTRRYSEQNNNLDIWNTKELLEQDYVTRYISNVLDKYSLTKIETDGPYTKRAGNLIHLRTDFYFSASDLNDKLGAFLGDLHPTPAVCGMPQKETFNLLLELEKHRREYYSGFLGPVGLNQSFELYVNLRCMKVLTDKLALFVGGGITSDSNPEDEWQETEFKTETLLSVIRQLNC